jgi:hypothetical protein
MSSIGSGSGKMDVYSKTNVSWRAADRILRSAAWCTGGSIGSEACVLLLLLGCLAVEQRCKEMRQLWSIGCKGL